MLCAPPFFLSPVSDSAFQVWQKKKTKEIRCRHAIEYEMNAQRHCCPTIDVVAHETAEQLRRKQQTQNIHNKRQTAAVTLWTISQREEPEAFRRPFTLSRRQLITRNWRTSADIWDLRLRLWINETVSMKRWPKLSRLHGVSCALCGSVDRCEIRMAWPGVRLAFSGRPI